MRDPQKATPGGSGQAIAETNTESPHMVAAGACLDKQRHPLSAAFGDMPADEFAELVRDIKRNGQISDIVKAADGSILDGWHRYRACIEAGITPRIEPFSYIIEAAAETAGRTLTEAEFVVAQNAHRRHLTAEQRRRVVAELLKADPAKSDRAIGSMAKVDHKTVAAVRRQAEGSGEIPQTSERKYSDGRTLTMPASKAVTAPAPIAKPAQIVKDDDVPPDRRLHAELWQLRELVDAIIGVDPYREDLIVADNCYVGDEKCGRVALRVDDVIHLHAALKEAMFQLSAMVEGAIVDPDPERQVVDSVLLTDLITYLSYDDSLDTIDDKVSRLLRAACSPKTRSLSVIADNQPEVQDFSIKYSAGRIVAVNGTEFAEACDALYFDSRAESSAAGRAKFGDGVRRLCEVIGWPAPGAAA